MVDTSRKTIEIYNISAENIKAHIASKTDNIHVIQTKNPKIRLYKINLRSKKMLVIPEAYNYFKELFKKKQIDSALLKHQDWDYEIKLKPKSQPRKKLIYPINTEKLNILRKYLNKNTIKGFIRES